MMAEQKKQIFLRRPSNGLLKPTRIRVAWKAEGDYGRAISDFTKAVNLDPRNPLVTIVSAV